MNYFVSPLAGATDAVAPKVDETVDDQLQNVIQDLYELQSSVHGYAGPATAEVLALKVQDIVASLLKLDVSAGQLSSLVTPEIIAYIEDGRNPDIYTREFVELVQKSNMLLKGKSEAFAGLRDMLAEELVTAGIASAEQVETLLAEDLESSIAALPDA